MVKHYEDIYCKRKYQEEFKKKYQEYLNNPKLKNPYIDIDAVDNINKTLFYDDLTKFLNIQEEKFFNKYKEKKYKYFPPKQRISEKLEINLEEIYNDKIIILYNYNNHFYLTSDQLGFSALQNRLLTPDKKWNNKNPYGNYLNKTNDVDFVSNCINDTRTIGGSFLWPIKKQNEKWETYTFNLGRSKNYIKDRIDLTLQEIKIFYDTLENSKDIKFEEIKKELKNKNCILLNYNDAEEIYSFLKHFNNFKTYVDYFCFKPFVNKNYDVIDITKISIKEYDRYDFSESREVIKKNEKVNIAILEKDSVKKMLNNVRLLTLKRSKEIEKIINDNKL